MISITHSRKQALTQFGRALAVPLLVITLVLLLTLLERLFGFSLRDMLINFVRTTFENHGYWIVFISAFLEGVLILGGYYPGGLVIFLAVISAGKDIQRVILVVSIVSLAFFLAYNANYLMGWHGWYKIFRWFRLQPSLEKAQRQLMKHAFNAIVLSYWHPDLASVTTTAAGVLRMPLRRFFPYSLFAILFWNCLWGFTVYSLGESALTLTGRKYILIALAIWLVVTVLRFLSTYYRKSRFAPEAQLDDKANDLEPVISNISIEPCNPTPVHQGDKAEKPDPSSP